jgi:hypothetical protein
VGIARNTPGRWNAHKSKNLKFFQDVGGCLSRQQARIAEQRAINHYGLSKNGGDLVNKRNEIDEKKYNISGGRIVPRFTFPVILPGPCSDFWNVFMPLSPTSCNPMA